jgi:hypothetical protein
MDSTAQDHLNNWVITIESSEDRHKQIIQSAVAKRAYEIFEKRGCKHGFDLEDWMSAEKELLRDDFDGNTSAFHFLLEYPRVPEVTTILSLTAHSLVVFRSHARLVSKANNHPSLLSVHVLPEEIDPAEAEVKAVDGLLHVYLPKKNNKGWRHENGGIRVTTKSELGIERGDGRGRRDGHG